MMKLSVFVVLVTIGLSHQYRVIFPLPYWAPRAHLAPLFSYGANQMEKNFGGLTNAIQPPFTVTRTLSFVKTIEVGTPKVSDCIPSSLFSTDSNSMVMTEDCPDSSRRRRDIEIDSIKPSITTPVETTQIPEDLNEWTPEIESSHEWAEIMPKRNFGGFSLTKTIYATSYDTVYSFTPVMDYKTISMANSGLICLPQGYAVCP